MIKSLRRYIGGSIARQFVVGLVAVQVVLTLAVSADLVRRQIANADAARIVRAQGLAEMLAASSAGSTLAEDRAGLQELIGSARAFPRMRYAMIISTTGEVLAHSDRVQVGRRLSDPLGRSLLTGPARPRVLAASRAAIEASAPIRTQNGRTIGWTWISIDREDLEAAKRTAILQAVLHVVGFALISTLLAWLMARHLARGLRQVSDAADRFRGGDREVRVTHERHDELGAVADGLNAMLDRIAETEASLRNAQRVAKIGAWRYVMGDPRLIWSPEAYEMFGIDPGEAGPAVDEIRRRFTPASSAAFQAVMETRPLPETFSLDLRYQKPDGKELVVWIEGRPEQDAAGNLVAMSGICQDITERDAAEAQLRQAQKMESVGQLTGGLAHDFNNLLAVVIGNLDLIGDELPPDSALAREFADVAMQAALKGSELTRQLLAFSRRQALDPKVLDVNTLVTGMEPLLTRTLGQDITVTLSLADGLWPAKVDQSQLESALLNLAINARDAMTGGGVLTIETHNITLDETTDQDLVPGDFAVVAVSDTGCGMSPEVLARVFEPFFTTKAVGKGTGLGLSMVYGFAKQSGGQLKIYSEVGVGTTVRLYLRRAERSAVVEEQKVDKGSVRGQGEKVLVVEDNPDVRRVVVRQLVELGYNVVQADDARTGLEILKSDLPIDLVFTDIIMPGGMTGIEMIEAARLRRPGLRVLFTTGFTGAATANNNRATGEDLLISKPYRRSDLAAKMREALAI